MESPRCGNVLTLGTATEEQIVHRGRRRTVRTGLALLSLLAAVPAFAQAPKAPNAPREDLTIDPETITQSWKGDLDQMVERRIVRVLVVPSKTFYFNDKGTQRGITYDAFQLVEQELQKRIDRDKTPAQASQREVLLCLGQSRQEVREFVMSSVLSGLLLVVPLYLAVLLLLKAMGSVVRLVQPIAQLLPRWSHA